MANPDTGEDTLDTAAEDQDSDAGDTQAQAGTDGADADNGEQSKLIFGKYKSMEEAEKGYVESERKLHEQASSLAEIKRDMESLKTQADLKTAILGITEIVKSRGEEKKPAVDFDAFTKSVGDKLAENPTEGVRMMATAFNTWTAQDREATVSEIKSLKEMISQMQTQVEDRVERADPFYEKNKTMIDRLVKDGMNLGRAKAFVREMAEAAGEDTRTAPPPKAGTNRVAGEPAKLSYWENQEERASFVRDYGEDIAKKMEEDFSKRVKANEQKARK